ncbi:MAG: aminoglycoside phosphotransferase family protein [Chitinophagaceae bacterium]|nr:aminoglycoside phosphotransferase family protein [Chitinophagaceae bacterium]
MNTRIQDLLANWYGWENAVFLPVASGLINDTSKVEADGHTYLCQKINTKVFKNPEQIDANLGMLANYLSVHAPGYLFTSPVVTVDGRTMVLMDDQYYRVFDWVKGSHSIEVVATPEQAFEAANQFGLFTSLLQGFDVESLHSSLPDFHHLSLRYHQFKKALLSGNTHRINGSAEAIGYLQSQEGIVKRYEAFIQQPDAHKRVTHHDTKISNILFNDEQKGICVIDLDTVMPGYFLSDVGDMFRTYVCPVSEEETDMNRISIRSNFMEAIQKGYLATMGDALSSFEKDHFFFAGEMLMYMQALRFMTDHLNNDVYYGCRYPDHNLTRAENQLRLLELFRKCL